MPFIEPGPAVTRLGDVWHLGRHRLICGDSTAASTYARLLDGEHAQMVFTDPPYNVKIDGHVGGLGKPPISSRFKKGTSRKLTGRPKGAQGRKKIVKDVLLEKRDVKPNGSDTVQRVTALELVLLVLREKALKGHVRALKSFKHFEALYS